MSCQPHNRMRGFTLLELLVAMTLLGLVMTMAFGGLRFGTRVWEAGEVHLDQRARLIGAQRVMRDMLGRLHPGKSDESADDDKQAVTGSSASIRFIALVHRFPETAGFHRVEIALDHTADRPDLVIRHSLLDEVDGAATTWQAGDADDRATAILVEGVSAVAFRYFGRRTGDDEPAWYNDWQDTALPNLIRIDVSFEEGDARVWPELTVAPQLVDPPEASDR